MSKAIRWSPEQLAEYERVKAAAFGKQKITIDAVTYTQAELKALRTKAGLPAKPSKMRNVKVVDAGIRFDSKKEHRRWQELSLMQKAGEIRLLRHHVSIPIIINAEVVCSYVADFTYFAGEIPIVEDVKSAFTRKLPVYRLKKKLLAFVLGIDILET